MFWIGGCGSMSKEGRAWTSVTEGWTVVGCAMATARSGRGFLAWSRAFPWVWRCGFGNTRVWYTMSGCRR